MSKKKMAMLFMSFVLILFLTACGGEKENKKGEGDGNFVVAKVNGVEITQGFVDKTYDTWLFMKDKSEETSIKKDSQDSDSKDSKDQEETKEEELVHYGRRESAIVKTNILNLKIKGLLIEEMYKKQNKTLSEKDLEEKYISMEKLMKEKMPEVLDFYKQNNIDKDFVKEGIKTNYYLAKYTEELDKKYREEYNLSQDEYKNFKLTVNPRIILLDDKETAEEVYKKIQSGVDFEKLVKDYSKDEVSKVRDGEMGSTRMDELPIEFAINLKDMKRGDVSEPFKSVFGYNIVKLIDFKSVEDMLQDKDLTETEEAATKTMVYDLNFHMYLDQKMNKLLDEAKIELFKDYYKEDAK